MAQSTAARAPVKARAGTSSRTPEVDSARALALMGAVVVLVGTGGLPAWLAPSAWVGTTVGDLLPAVFATVAGVAVAHQVVAHDGAGPTWWSLRVARRLAVLVVLGVVLHLTSLPPRTLAEVTWLRVTSDLARIGVASVVALALVRLPRRIQLYIAATLVLLHTVVVMGSGTELTPAGAGIAGWDARLLGGRALAPVDPDGPTALAPTLALVLAGSWVGSWLRSRGRGAATVGLLLAGGAVSGGVAWLLGTVLPPIAALWTLPVLAGGMALTLAALAAGQAGTRIPLTDRVVATLSVAGRVTLPLWAVAVLGERWLLGTAPVRWIVRHVLVPPLGADRAALVLGLLVGLGLLRLGGALVDRGLHLRA